MVLFTGYSESYLFSPFCACRFEQHSSQACEVSQQNQYSHYKCDQNGDLKCLPGNTFAKGHLNTDLISFYGQRMARRPLWRSIVQEKLRPAARILQKTEWMPLQTRLLWDELWEMHSITRMSKRRMQIAIWMPLSQRIRRNILSRTWELNLKISFLASNEFRPSSATPISGKKRKLTCIINFLPLFKKQFVDKTAIQSTAIAKAQESAGYVYNLKVDETTGIISSAGNSFDNYDVNAV